MSFDDEITHFALQDTEATLQSTDRQQGLMREENANLKHDTNVLINVISSARTHGRWDVRIFESHYFRPRVEIGVSTHGHNPAPSRAPSP